MNRIILFIALFSGVFIEQGHAQKDNARSLFNKSLSSYYTLKNALATDKVTAAQSAAQELQLAVKAVPQNSFKAGLQQLWAKESVTIQEQSVILAGETDLKLQRKSFERISMAFIRLTKGMQLNDQTAYIQYCPMVKASWLNEVKAVQNPYYGSMMYDCGEVTATVQSQK